MMYEIRHSRYNFCLSYNLVKLATTLLFALVVKSENAQETRPQVNRLLLMTIPTDPFSDGFKRFNRSVETYGLDLVVLNRSHDNEYALKTLKRALTTYKSESDLAIMIVDSNSLILNGNNKEILKKFDKFDKRSKIVFMADSSCLPDPKLESKYPLPAAGGELYLSSSALIGLAPSLWDLYNAKQSLLGNDTQNNDLQLFSTLAYLDSGLRNSLGIELDHRAELFQNLRSLESDVELEFNLNGVKVKNSAYLTEPVVVYGIGASKVVLNSLGNYLAKAWTVKDGCNYCNDSSISLASTKNSELPKVLVGLFIEEPTPFLEHFFEDFRKLNYSTNRIHLFLHNSVKYHDKQIDNFIRQLGSQYASQQVFNSETSMLEWEARNEALERCKEITCDYYFSLDSLARLELPETLKILIEANRNIVAPLLSRPKKLWSNFWGSLTAEGYYARSHDYVSLVKRDRVGLWNVAHVMNAYLLNGAFIRRHLNGTQQQPNLSYRNETLGDQLKPVLTLSHQLRLIDSFQYMINTHEFGHLIDPSSYNTSHLYPDFYQLDNNMIDWERSYLHENYTRILDDEVVLEKPCQDVAWFPLVNERFCAQMIEMMEAFGQWSSGTNDDPRIEGGYESVPTRDIHMKQVGLHEMWLTFLREYIQPVQLKEYIGYEHDPPRTDLAFVVRYNPKEQPFLRPHHDSSTYTLNIALNTPHLDYEGGGCRFVRYNCSVTETRRGWALIHPGRLTHYHEGLPVSKGTRYIMVTFVDP